MQFVKFFRKIYAQTFLETEIMLEENKIKHIYIYILNKK